jgi:hypothetical protein
MTAKDPYLIPIIEPMDPRRCNVYEHTPLDYYGSGEYPRFLRPPGANQGQTRTVWLTAEEARKRGLRA